MDSSFLPDDLRSVSPSIGGITSDLNSYLEHYVGEESVFLGSPYMSDLFSSMYRDSFGNLSSPLEDTMNPSSRSSSRSEGFLQPLSMSPYSSCSSMQMSLEQLNLSPQSDDQGSPGSFYFEGSSGLQTSPSMCNSNFSLSPSSSGHSPCHPEYPVEYSTFPVSEGVKKEKIPRKNRMKKSEYEKMTEEEKKDRTHQMERQRAKKYREKQKINEKNLEEQVQYQEKIKSNLLAEISHLENKKMKMSNFLQGHNNLNTCNLRFFDNNFPQ